MNHTPRRPAVLLAILLLALPLVLASCARGPRAVPLDELAADPDAFHGKTISVTGKVRLIQDGLDDAGRHYVLEDGEANRVRLLPDEEAARHADEFVRVVGPFAFDETAGRRIRIERIERPSA